MADIRQKAVATADSYHQGNIAGLDDAMTRRLVASTVLTESHGGDLNAKNSAGYVGRYQAGASWLVEAGYVDRTKFETALKASGYKSEWEWAVHGGMSKFLENPGNWKNGLSLDKYMASAELQDQAFKTNCDKTYNRAIKAGLLHENDPPEKVAGFLKAAHLSGYGGARDALHGIVHKDANGTSNMKYYNDIAQNGDHLNELMPRNRQQATPGQTQPQQPGHAPSASADGKLSYGEDGPEIKQLQHRLNALGYGRPDGTPLHETGHYGDNTRAAVIKFQKDHGLEPTGEVGYYTLAALAKAEQQSQGSQAQAAPQAAKAPASYAIYNEAFQHFLADGNKFEYGRGDMTLTNKEGNGKTDPSRTEQDLDGDGLKGVDCSSFVWRGLKDAGYDVPKQPFGTHDLFNGHQVTDYSKKHFDVISGADASRANGPLQPGDIVLFKDKNGDGQHVGIVKGYDSQGHLQFIGSQVSTGPAQATVGGPGSYWNGGEFEIVGALRAKPEFQVRAPLHGTPDAPQAPGTATQNTPAAASPMADGQLKRGEEGPEIAELQKRLNKLGYGREDGTPLVENGKFGPNTEAAVIKFQQEHGLQGLGVVGPKTLAALDAAEKAQAQGSQTPDVQTPRTQPQGAQAEERLALGDRLPPEVLAIMKQQRERHPTGVFSDEAAARIDEILSGKKSAEKPAEKPGDTPHVDAHAGKLLLTNPQHPDNKLYQQALSTLEQLGPSGGFKSREELERVAAAVAADAKLSGLTQIDHITRSKNGEGLIAIQGADPWSDTAKRAFVERSQAVNQTVEQSSEMVNAKAAEKIAQPVASNSQLTTEPVTDTPKRTGPQQ